MPPRGILIIVTGVPGTGKTTISRLLAKRLGGRHLDIGGLALEEGLVSGSDPERDTKVADLPALRRRVAAFVGGRCTLVIDGHYSSSVVARGRASLVVVLRRAPWVLREEFKARGYPLAKVRENVEAELLGVCLAEALSEQDPTRVCELDTTGIEPEETVKEIAAILSGEATCLRGMVDWMDAPEAEELLRSM
jgi:adenylate kinase